MYKRISGRAISADDYYTYTRSGTASETGSRRRIRTVVYGFESCELITTVDHDDHII